jgi:hypothetical protein
MGGVLAGFQVVRSGLYPNHNGLGVNGVRGSGFFRPNPA